MIEISAVSQSWPLKEAFTISRGSKTCATIVEVAARSDTTIGRGEAVPYARYGETVEGVLSQISAIGPRVLDRQSLLNLMKPGAARNALDCALWDLECKTKGVSAALLAGVPPAKPVITAFTLSLDLPDVMARKARAASHLPLLKLKLGGPGDDERMRAVRAARPDARLIVDANEAWTETLWLTLVTAAKDCGIEVIEQPLPAERDGILRDLPRPVPICADESIHTSDDLPRVATLYDAVNIKLDKAGGLTSALEIKREARARGLKIMVGSMVATSLAVAPALILATDVEWTDLDGPLLLSSDRDAALEIANGLITPPSPALWG